MRSAATITAVRRVYLIGNPNVGKSALFGRLCRNYASVSNYPGTTVELSYGSLPSGEEVVDTPGTYSVSDLSEDERVTKRAILERQPNDLVINVINAATLRRDLYLTLQLADMGVPMVVVLNQMDEVERQGLKIDTDKLGWILGVPVYPISAVGGNGVEELKDAVAQGLRGKPPNTGLEPNQPRRQRADRLVNSVVSSDVNRAGWFGAMDRILLHPIWGSLIATVLAVALMYQVLGVWVAGDIVDFLEGGIFERFWNPGVRMLVGDVLPEGRPWGAVATVLAGQYGLFTLTVTYLLGVLLPLIWAFYFGWALFEDTGYLPRLSVLGDGLLRSFGLNGKGIIPLVLGLGCVTMAMVTTRLASSRREQLILMILLSIAVPCSAQLGIIQGLLASMGGITGWLIWAATLLSVLSVAGLLANKIIPGTSQSLIMDLPPLRVPRLDNLLTKANQKSWFFLKESGTAFVGASLVVSVCQVMGWLEVVIGWLQPLVEGVLHLPKEVAVSFLLGMVRRDFGAFGLLDLPLSGVQAVTACVTLTLFVPCIATVGVMIKERNFATAAGIWCLSWGIGFGVGGTLTRVLERLPLAL